MMLHVEPAFLCIADAPLELLTALPQHTYGVMALLADTGECTDGTGPKLRLPAMARHNAVVEHNRIHMHAPRSCMMQVSAAGEFIPRVGCRFVLGFLSFLAYRSAALTCNRGTETGMH